MSVSFWFSLGLLVVVAGVGLEFFHGIPRIRRLQDWATDLPEGQAWPKISILFSALNEEATLEPALRSMLALDYPDLQVVAVNDRSTDQTPAILDRLAREFPQLQVLHIQNLPPGWLGKVHALHQAAQVATGDYLLFTDADVRFEATTLRRAAHYCAQQKPDHLVLLYESMAQGLLLRMMLIAMQFSCYLLTRPWSISQDRRRFIGVGAFNLVRASSYRAMGGHAALPLAVVDDVELGRLMKQHGYSQHALDGRGMVFVEWYRSAREMYQGLLKSSFAAHGFQLIYVGLTTLVVSVFHIWPWIGLLVGDAWVALLCGLILLGEALIYYRLWRNTPWGWGCLLLFPLVAPLQIIELWHSALMALWRGGISWRGSFYSLQELRAALGQQKRG